MTSMFFEKNEQTSIGWKDDYLAFHAMKMCCMTSLKNIFCNIVFRIVKKVPRVSLSRNLMVMLVQFMGVLMSSSIIGRHIFLDAMVDFFFSFCFNFQPFFYPR